MIKIEGERGSGKTTTLLYLAHGRKSIVVEPTSKRGDFVRKMARELGLDVTVISIDGFMMGPYHQIRDKDITFLFDDLDECLQQLHVKGYSRTI